MVEKLINSFLLEEQNVSLIKRVRRANTYPNDENELIEHLGNLVLEEGLPSGIVEIGAKIGLALNKKVKEHNNEETGKLLGEALDSVEKMLSSDNIRGEMLNLFEGVLPALKRHFSDRESDKIKLFRAQIIVVRYRRASGNYQGAEEFFQRALPTREGNSFGDYDKERILLEWSIPILKEYAPNSFESAIAKIRLKEIYEYYDSNAKARRFLFGSYDIELLEGTVPIVYAQAFDDPLAVEMRTILSSIYNVGNIKGKIRLALTLKTSGYDNLLSGRLLGVVLDVVENLPSNDNRIQEVLSVFEDVLSDLQQHFPGSMQLFRTQIILARYRRASGNYQGAEELFQRALPTREGNSFGDYDKERILLEWTVPILKKYAPDSLELAMAETRLYKVYQYCDNNAKRQDFSTFPEEDLLKDASSIVSGDLPSSPELDITREDIADIYARLNKYQEGASMLEKSLSALESRRSNSPRLAGVLIKLGNLYVGLRDYEKAKSSFEKAVPILQRHNLDTGLAQVQVRLSKIYGRSSDDQKAKNLFQSAIRIADNKLRERKIENLPKMQSEIFKAVMSDNRKKVPNILISYATPVIGVNRAKSLLSTLQTAKIPNKSQESNLLSPYEIKPESCLNDVTVMGANSNVKLVGN